jgi:hypothetical protein
MGFIAVSVLTGCVKRKESIRVAPDGAVRLQTEIIGDPGDVAGGDAMPDAAAGWTVHDETIVKDDGKEEQHRSATLTVQGGAELPDSYAPVADGVAYRTSLRFPTELTIDRRPDGTYYNFRRVYLAREQARYEWYRKLFEQSLGKLDLAGKDPADLTDAERTNLLDHLRTLQALKMSEYVRSGAAAMEDHWPQYYGLILRQGLLDYFAEVDLTPIVTLMKQPAGPGRDDAIAGFGTALIVGARDRLLQTLGKLRVPAAEADAFFAAYDEEETRRTVTEDLGDEDWDVRVTLPGQLIAHDGDRVDGDSVVWTFKGEALMDRDQILSATSRVPARSAPAKD